MRPVKDLHLLPRVRDSWSYLYAERCYIDRDQNAIAIHEAGPKGLKGQKGKTIPVPCASLSLLLLGPGATVTHAAIRALADNGCMIAWVGEGAVRFYAHGLGETRSAKRLLRQARLWANSTTRLRVVRRMYEMRFPEPLDDALTLQQIRGREGVRVREAYQRASRETGVPWAGRSYKRDAWERADPINRALSAANSCLYGVCHAAIVAAGYSPALGFVHTGKMLSFVYDIADLYKADLTVPAAFRAVLEGEIDLEGRVRRHCRDVFHQHRLLERIMPDIDRVLLGNGTAGDEIVPEEDVDSDAALPGDLWDPETGVAPGGVNHSELAEDVVGQLEAEVRAQLGPVTPSRRVVITGGEWPQANRDNGA